jgi:hypothetical protein
MQKSQVKPPRFCCHESGGVSQTDSGLGALLLSVSSAPEQEPLAGFPVRDDGEVLERYGAAHDLPLSDAPRS